MRRVEIFNLLTASAEALYPPREAEQIARIIMSDVASVSTTQLILDPNAECNIEHLDLIIEDIKRGRPVQYITGRAEFCSLDFVVREGVLIPRPETEELVMRIVEEAEEAPRILDIGCGSGAIAISLAKLIPDSHVVGLDISKEALAISRENCKNLNASVNFIEGDALEGVENYTEGEYDIIVSNPPYIPISEAESMRCNVVDYEPEIALFVEDENPLIFYRAIARSAQKLLRSEGLLYFEIHENFAHETVEMLREMGYIAVTIIYDINDKARMICAEKN